MVPLHRSENGMPDRVNAWVEIALDSLRHNVRVIRAAVGPDTSLLVPVKADAYGHGAVPVSRAVLESGADMLGVANPEEGQLLREAGIDAPVLVLGAVLPDQAADVVSSQLWQTVSTAASIDALARCSSEAGARAGVFLAVDTGMGRVGVDPRGALELARRIAAREHLELLGVSTHFPSADEADKQPSLDQLAVFRGVLRSLHAAGIDPKYVSAANSPGVIDIPESRFNLVRPGLATYGVWPSRDTLGRLRVWPALSLHARVVQLRTFPPGHPISYGMTAVTQREARIGVVPVGYGDGYSRRLSNVGCALVRGRRAPLVGRVCMDQCMFDLTDVPGAVEGDEAVLIGTQGGDHLLVERIAEAVDTTPHEITTVLGSRLPRFYTDAERGEERRLLSTARIVHIWAEGGAGGGAGGAKAGDRAGGAGSDVAAEDGAGERERARGATI